MAIDPRRIPIIGDDIYQVGQVYRIASQPCGIDPWIAVQATFTYAPTLIWSLLKPTPMDLAFDRVGRRHRTIRKRRFKADDVWQLPQPEKPGVQRAMFRVADLTQKIGWYFLIADATTDFALNWTSMAYSFSGCHVPGAAWAKVSGPSGIDYLSTVAPITSELFGSTFERHGEASAGTHYVDLWGTGPKTFTGSCRFTVQGNAGHTPQVHRVWFERHSQGMPIKDMDAENPRPNDPTSSYDTDDTITFGAHPRTLWRGYIEHTGARITVHDFRMSAVEAPPAGLEFDP